MRTIKAHLLYGKYVLIHKWYVGLALVKYYGLWWRAITHDLSKFRFDEWTPYVNYFYLSDRQNFGHNTSTGTPFDYAWNRHQKRNSHHWQFYILVYDSDPDKIKCLEMPINDAREMICDWYGAGMAKGDPDIGGWYNKHKDKILLHPVTRLYVEQELKALGFEV